MTIQTISQKVVQLETAADKKNKVKPKKLLVESVKRGLRFLWKDLTKPHLVWVKLIFFLQSASLVALYPYLVSIIYVFITKY